jgi:hypothetical protein
MIMKYINWMKTEIHIEFLYGNFIYSGRLEEMWDLRIRMDGRWKEQAQGCGKWRVFS